MGWCGGTEVFDAAVDVYIECEFPETDQILNYVTQLYNSKAFKYSDWDCQSESKYWNPYLIEIMHDNDELDEEDYLYYKNPEDYPDY